MNDINAMASSLSSASTWIGSRNPLGHLPSSQDDYVYEFYCYIRVLHDLHFNHLVVLNSGSGENKNKFPLKPALKSKGWARFDICEQSGTLLYQVCAGTKVRNTKFSQSLFAPDISFQKHDATDDPTQNDVELIMDAKFKDGGGKLPIGVFREMAEFINSLETSNASAIKITFQYLKDLKQNCLLTNGEISPKEEDYCKIRAIRQVGNFAPGFSKFMTVG
jgi:hypothetical protein